MRSLLRDRRGAMALTFGQAFIGVLTLGIGLSRGIEADVSVQTERVNGDANYAVSRVGAAHAKAANAIADNNVLAAAVMGPRLAVEADVITMDENGKIACTAAAAPIPDPSMKEICAQYTANRPRAAAKLAWIRTAQTGMWGSLEALSGAMHKVAAARAVEDVTRTLATTDPGSHARFMDPAAVSDPFSQRSAGVGCSLARRDTLPTPMVGHAFPLLMPNMLEGLPHALVVALPQAMCPDTSMSMGGMPGGMPNVPLSLPQIPSVNDKAKKDCDEREDHMRAQSDAAGSSATTRPTFSSDVDPFIKCVAGTPKAPLASSDGSMGRTFVVKKNGKLYTCSFDKKECQKKRLEVASADFLKGIGLPSIPSFSLIGGSTRSPGVTSPNDSDAFRSSVTVSKPENASTVRITDAARNLLTFGGVAAPTVLHDEVRRTSATHFYFPTGGGNPLAVVPFDQQGFVAGWKHALVSARPGGGG